MIDVVAAAPAWFHTTVRRALEDELPFLLPGVFRTRFHLYERWSQEECVTRMDRIAAKGSHGVVLMAPDVQEAVAAVDRLQAVGIPVITLASDLPVSRRLAYVGIDNRSGVTAAYLLS
ncbi:substrate-binding protein domain-containing protein [Arthrobacter sp. VKM Ac-2550]|nr:substrate-binding protein domain-containing protein [Arthrobacter sp. VKM Ac-2550]